MHYIIRHVFYFFSPHLVTTPSALNVLGGLFCCLLFETGPRNLKVTKDVLKVAILLSSSVLGLQTGDVTPAYLHSFEVYYLSS